MLRRFRRYNQVKTLGIGDGLRFGAGRSSTVPSAIGTNTRIAAISGQGRLTPRVQARNRNIVLVSAATEGKEQAREGEDEETRP